MKNFRPFLLLLITIGLGSITPAFSQAQCNLLQANNAVNAAHNSSASYWFGVLELPFLFISVVFAFLTAYALRGGRFGIGVLAAFLLGNEIDVTTRHVSSEDGEIGRAHV